MNIRTDIIDSTIDDRYYIKHFVGEGGFGMVFNVEHRIFDIFFRNVALKVFKEGKVTTETAKKTFNDAIILAKIIDQNREKEGCRYLVHVFDIGILKDLDYRGYVSMEYISGGDLHNYMKQRHCPVPIDSVLNYMEQICKGLSVLHCQNNPFIHRDLKLANLLFTDSKKEQIKIVDFGLATAVDKILGDASNAGTIHCQAPESFDNFSNDPRSDVYSLGLIFYEMLTQHHPFEAIGRDVYKENKLEYILLQAEARKTFAKDGEPPSKFNMTVAKMEGLDDLIMKCLDFYPGNRFSDASSLLKSIEKLKNGQNREERPKSTDETIMDSINEGKFYLEKSNYGQALMILENTYKKIIFHKKEKTFPELFFTLGKAYFKTGNNNEAIKKYQEGLRIKPLGKYCNELAEIFNCIKRPNLAGIMKKKANDLPYEEGNEAYETKNQRNWAAAYDSLFQLHPRIQRTRGGNGNRDDDLPPTDILKEQFLCQVVEPLRLKANNKRKEKQIEADYAMRIEPQYQEVERLINGLEKDIKSVDDNLEPEQGLSKLRVIVQRKQPQIEQKIRFIGEVWSIHPTKKSVSHIKTKNIPGGRVDRVHFSVTSPPVVLLGTSFVIDVWAHLERQRSQIIKRAREAYGKDNIHIKSKGPVHVSQGTILYVRLKIADLIVEDPEDTILWEGDIGNATFPVTVPNNIQHGSKPGCVLIYVEGLQIGKIHFNVQVGRASSNVENLPVSEERYRKAFASYAKADRNAVMARIQGILKAAPLLNVFLDVFSLRSGQNWEQELQKVIPSSDVFYLFWSKHAKASRWVEQEWRCALEKRGIDFIDPVPLVSPEKVPPPPELASIHFNDWVLAFMRSERSAR